ncbi:MAG: anti-sigma F factor [Clostridia bacterium]|nr:anti-sigma F factor [Clostridia bacterium]
MRSALRGKTKLINSIKATFDSVSENESLARIIITGFISGFDGVSASDIADVKTAVSEAVTNAIVHGYRKKDGKVTLAAKLTEDGDLTVTVSDKGVGIENVKQAMEPFFTTDKEGERSGMGFAIMKTFTRSLRVTSAPGKGTRVTMKRKIGAGS